MRCEACTIQNNIHFPAGLDEVEETLAPPFDSASGANAQELEDLDYESEQEEYGYTMDEPDGIPQEG